MFKCDSTLPERAVSAGSDHINMDLNFECAGFTIDVLFSDKGDLGL